MYLISSEEEYEDGQVIFAEGNSGDWIYLVNAGKVEISKSIGGVDVVVAVVEEGDVFGEMSFLSGTPRSATARAVGHVTLGIIDRAFLDEEFNKLSTAFRDILKILIGRLRETTEKAAQVQRRRTHDRLSRTVALTIKTPGGLVKAFTEDMSIGGMFIRVSKPLAIQDVFTLKLTLPERSEPLDIGCEVVWTRTEDHAGEGKPVGMGVKFVELSDDDHRILKEELRKQLRVSAS